MEGYQPGNLCFLLCIAWMKIEKGSYLFAKIIHIGRLDFLAAKLGCFGFLMLGLGLAVVLHLKYGMF